MLYCIILHILNNITLYYIVLHYVALYYVTSNYIISHYITLYNIMLNNITLYYTILHYIKQSYIILNYIVSNYIIYNLKLNHRNFRLNWLSHNIQYLARHSAVQSAPSVSEGSGLQPRPVASHMPWLLCCSQSLGQAAGTWNRLQGRSKRSGSWRSPHGTVL